MIEIVFFWLICGVVGAAMLSRYNRAGTGCLLGGLLGPIGLIIAFIMRDDKKLETERREKATPAAQPSRDERECPFCAESILAKARVCKHCGRDVEPSSAGS